MRDVRLGPLWLAIRRGEPVEAAGWKVTPLMAVAALTRRRASITPASVSGTGYQWAALRPLAVEVERGGRRRLMLVPDVTRLLLGLMAVSVLVSGFLALTRGRRR